jgi:hypothetical protein
MGRSRRAGSATQRQHGICGSAASHPRVPGVRAAAVTLILAGLLAAALIAMPAASWAASPPPATDPAAASLLLAETPSEATFIRGRGKRSRAPASGVSMTPSATTPHWACPTGACEEIIDPPPLPVSGRYALSEGGPLLEGGGELGGLDPQDLRSAYKIPTAGGADQTVALVDAFGYRGAESDLATYRARYGLGECTGPPPKGNGCFRKVNQAGEEANYPRETGEGWEAESALDMDMASAACPHCHILLVQASSEEPEDLAKAVNTAARLGATEISNSYGFPEQDCEPEESNCQEFSSDYRHPGVLVTASSGDSGYEDWLNFRTSTEFPATSPNVAAVGGTALRKASNSRGWSEEAWRAGGSGCSKSEPKPSWQVDQGCANRTVSDVAAVAACETPVSVYVKVFGGWNDVCGTSVSSPLVAAIEAHASEYARSLPGGAAFYEDPGALFDVTAGRQGECTPPGEDQYLCYAKAGYDGPTGEGTPDGSLQLAGGPPAVATRAASAVSTSAATLNGTIDPNDLETSYHFEYGTGTSYGTSVPLPSAVGGSGKLPEEVGQAITGLKPDTTYHYRLTATNSAGSSDGEDRSFTTAPPTVARVQASAGPSVGGTSVRITGTGLAGATAVRFGSSDASSFTVRSDRTITAVSPPGTGAVDVTVTTGAGTSATGPADEYLYALGPKLTPGDESGRGAFGSSVALSADGRTALIGAPVDNNGRGAARVFTRSGRVWTEQGTIPTPSDAGREGLFGSSVALSADGSTALIGGPVDNNRHGEAWVFTRSGGAWTEQAAILSPSGAPIGITGFFGWSVALSADGSTALIGDPLDGNHRGSAWVFTRSGGAWTQQGTIVTPSNAGPNDFFGWSVALSANGSTALIGAPDNNGSSFGTAWVFTRSGATWTQGEELNPRNVSGSGRFGASVALADSGDTALVGGISSNHKRGAAWVFTRSGAAWIQEGEPLNPGVVANRFFGPRVALSANGGTALIGEGNNNHGNGGAWVFMHSGAAWIQQGEGFNPSDESLEGAFGGSLALSANGGTALVGAPGDRGELGAETLPTWPWSGYGAAWVFTRSGSTWSR